MEKIRFRSTYGNTVVLGIDPGYVMHPDVDKRKAHVLYVEMSPSQELKLRMALASSASDPYLGILEQQLDIMCQKDLLKSWQHISRLLEEPWETGPFDSPWLVCPEHRSKVKRYLANQLKKAKCVLDLDFLEKDEVQDPKSDSKQLRWSDPEVVDIRRNLLSYTMLAGSLSKRRTLFNFLHKIYTVNGYAVAERWLPDMFNKNFSQAKVEYLRSKLLY